MANYQSTHTGAEIDAGIDLLNNNSATSGQVLTANGTGGASWQNATGGSGGGTTIEGHTVTFNSTLVYNSRAGYVMYLDNNLKPCHAIIESNFSLTINNVYKIIGLYLNKASTGKAPNYYGTNIEEAIGTPKLISNNGFDYIRSTSSGSIDFTNNDSERNLFVFKDCILTFSFIGGGGGA